MYVGITRHAVALVIIVAVAGAAFRISTAPDRIRERHETAHAVCVAAGGQWVTVNRDDVCVKNDGAKTP